MSLLGISPLAWGLGLFGFAAGLFALHLLRVRLRRQTVDSLLFFRQVGAVRRPRGLLGAPSRWLSYALGLALLAALWTAFANPVPRSDGPSRSIVIDASAGSAALRPDGSTTRAALTAQAEQLADDGLGPRGRVISAGVQPRGLWSDGEPLQRIDERGSALGTGGSSSTLWSALAAAADGLAEGDEIVLLGGPRELPAAVGAIPLRRAAAIDATAIAGVVAVRRTPGSTTALEIEVTTGGGAATVRARDGGRLVASSVVEAAAGASARTVLGPLPEDAGTLSIDVLPEGGVAGPAVEVGPIGIPRIRVHVSERVPAAARLAIEADPRAELSGMDQAEVLVATDADALPADRAALIFDVGSGARPRRPRRTASCPRPRGLRDRARSSATALAGVEDAVVWVEDAGSGEPLVISEDAGGHPRIRAVSWLLEPLSHRDVPALVLGAVHALAAPAPLSVRGALTAPAPAGAASAPELDDRAGAFPLSLALLAVALLLLAADIWLHHRGRTA